MEIPTKDQRKERNHLCKAIPEFLKIALYLRNKYRFPMEITAGS